MSENSGSLVWSLKWGLISFSFYRLRVVTFLRDDFRAVRPLELAPGGASPEPSWTRLVAVRPARNQLVALRPALNRLVAALLKISRPSAPQVSGPIANPCDTRI